MLLDVEGALSWTVAKIPAGHICIYLGIPCPGSLLETIQGLIQPAYLTLQPWYDRP